MTTIVNLIVILALVAAVVVALEHNHSRNGRPRVAGFTGIVGALPTDRASVRGAALRDPDWTNDTDEAPLFS
jgi:hypothetical protein